MEARKEARTWHTSGEALRFGAHVPLSTLCSDARASSRIALKYELPKAPEQLTVGRK